MSPPLAGGRPTRSGQKVVRWRFRRQFLRAELVTGVTATLSLLRALLEVWLSLLITYTLRWRLR